MTLRDKYVVGNMCRCCGTNLNLLQRENAELREWVRVVGEETVLAGYPGGDRNQTLKNIRDMRADAERLRIERDCIVETELEPLHAKCNRLMRENTELRAALDATRKEEK